MWVVLSVTICKNVTPLKNINELYCVCFHNDYDRKIVSYNVLFILSPAQQRCMAEGDSAKSQPLLRNFLQDPTSLTQAWIHLRMQTKSPIFTKVLSSRQYHFNVYFTTLLQGQCNTLNWFFQLLSVFVVEHALQNKVWFDTISKRTTVL